MKKRILEFLVVFTFIFSSVVTFSNDWEFGSRGEHIIPLKSSEVAIKKEQITMKLMEDGMLVNVKFTFDSPIAETKVIGFITPEDFSEEYEEAESITSLKDINIKNFKTKVNGKTVKSNVDLLKNILSKGILDKDTVKKYEDKKYKNSYIYYFNADFVKGTNTVEHSYFYTGSYGVYERDFEYVLTTISKWKNQKVDDFELTIDTGNYFVRLPYTFWKNNKKIDWEIVGEGKIAFIDKNTVKKLDEDYGEQVFAKLKNGYIRFRAKNFSPDFEFFTERFDNILGMSYLFPEEDVQGYKFKDNLLEAAVYANEKELRELSDKELDIVRNYPYAVAGYEFSKKELKDYYSKFFWYAPVGKNVKIVDINDLIKTVDKIKKEKSNKKIN